MRSGSVAINYEGEVKLGSQLITRPIGARIIDIVAPLFTIATEFINRFLALAFTLTIVFIRASRPTFDSP